MHIHDRVPMVHVNYKFGWKFKQELTPSLHNVDLFKESIIWIKRPSWRELVIIDKPVAVSALDSHPCVS